MSKDYLDVALILEKNGVEFYASLAEESENSDTKKLFEKFAREEIKHLQTFKMLKSTHTSTKLSLSDEEYQAILANLDDKPILPVLNNKKDIHIFRAIEMGVATEKRTVQFYKDIARRMHNAVDRSVVESIISEEEDHVQNLEKMLVHSAFSL